MKKILIVEDSLIVRKMLEALVKPLGHEVIGCECVQEAMNVSGAHMAILDYRLPDGTGLDVAKRLKASNPSTTTVLLTARGNEAEKEGARTSKEIDIFLEKPVNGKTLLDLLERHL